MDLSEETSSKINTPILIVIILETIIIFAMLVFAGYLYLKIEITKASLAKTETVGATSQTTNTADSDCPTGKQGTSAQGNYKVDGTEKITVAGKELNLCCGKIENAGKTTKVCSDKSNSNIVMYEKTNGQFNLFSEMYSKGEKRCVKSYQDPTQNNEICI